LAQTHPRSSERRPRAGGRSIGTFQEYPLQRALVGNVTRAPLGKDVPLLVLYESGLSSQRRESKIRVVDPQQEPVFGARRKHPVRLEASLRDQIVHENPDVRLVTPEDERSFVPDVLGRVRTCHDPLSCGFFVP